MGDLMVSLEDAINFAKDTRGLLKYDSGPAMWKRALLVLADHLETLMAAPGGEACSRCKGECGRTDEEFYGDRIIEVHWIDCEHCNGTGEEPRTATAVDDGVLKMVAELCDELEAELQARYPERGNYDVEHRRFNRDMTTVTAAREFIAAMKEQQDAKS